MAWDSAARDDDAGPDVRADATCSGRTCCRWRTEWHGDAGSPCRSHGIPGDWRASRHGVARPTPAAQGDAAARTCAPYSPTRARRRSRRRAGPPPGRGSAPCAGTPGIEIVASTAAFGRAQLSRAHLRLHSSTAGARTALTSFPVRRPHLVPGSVAASNRRGANVSSAAHMTRTEAGRPSGSFQRRDRRRRLQRHRDGGATFVAPAWSTSSLRARARLRWSLAAQLVPPARRAHSLVPVLVLLRAAEGVVGPCSPQGEILEYLHRVACDNEVDDRIRCGTEIASAAYDEARRPGRSCPRRRRLYVRRPDHRLRATQPAGDPGDPRA